MITSIYVRIFFLLFVMDAEAYLHTLRLPRHGPAHRLMMCNDTTTPFASTRTLLLLPSENEELSRVGNWASWLSFSLPH